MHWEMHVRVEGLSGGATILLLDRAPHVLTIGRRRMDEGFHSDGMRANGLP